RRSDLREALNLPIGLAIVLLGALFVLLDEFAWADCIGIIGYSFGLASILNSIALALVITNLIRAHVNYEYAYVPTPKEMLDYREKLIRFYEGEGNAGDAATLAEKDTVEYMAQEFANNAHINFLNNNQKS